MKKREKSNWKILILSLIIVYSFAFIGSIFTPPNTDTEWYTSIKTAITPPNWIFPVVWDILFFLISLSLYIAWVKSSKKQKTKIAVIFGINLLLNVAWSFLFFFLQNPVLAFFDLILLWLSIIAMICIAWKINKMSSYLLVPYFLWVSFAGVLNYLIAF